MTDDPLDGVRRADAGVRDAHLALRRAVLEARDAGVAWARIGETLGITRQAAFKRFGAPRDPRTGETMTATPLDTATLIDATETLWRDIDAGAWEAVELRLHPEVAGVLDRDAVLGTWASAVAETGNLEACRDPRIEDGHGVALEDGQAVLGGVVAHAELVCEAGTWLGRVAWDEQARVAGLLILPPDTPRRDFAF
ncbi:hypothetical protein GCM10027425_15500 [Alteromonas gracilis]